MILNSDRGTAAYVVLVRHLLEEREEKGIGICGLFGGDVFFVEHVMKESRWRSEGSMGRGVGCG